MASLRLTLSDHPDRDLPQPVRPAYRPWGTGQEAPAADPCPGVRIRPTVSGFEAKVKTLPGVGRREFEKQAEHLANVWRCERVSVAQPKPGRLTVRALRTDPLLAPLALIDAPASGDEPWKVWLGRDEYGADRFLDLRNVSGICVGGQPGGGKSQAVTSWLTQLAPWPAAQFVTVDGKGAGEFDDFAPRAWITAGDSMDGALAILDKLVGLMYSRLACVREFTGGKKNIWTVGVSELWPLIFAVFDETADLVRHARRQGARQGAGEGLRAGHQARRGAGPQRPQRRHVLRVRNAEADHAIRCRRRCHRTAR